MASPKHVSVDVIVIVDSHAPGGVRFELSSGIGTPDKLTFKNKNHPGFIVNFDLVDPGNTGCKFVHRKEDAMWVRTFEPGDPDPCPRSEMWWDQFEASAVNMNDTRLVVRNLNEFCQDFAFSLRIEKPGIDEPILYDPIGSNQNGGQREVSFLSTESVGGFVAGAIVGALVTMALS